MFKRFLLFFTTLFMVPMQSRATSCHWENGTHRFYEISTRAFDLSISLNKNTGIYFGFIVSGDGSNENPYSMRTLKEPEMLTYIATYFSRVIKQQKRRF